MTLKSRMWPGTCNMGRSSVTSVSTADIESGMQLVLLGKYKL